MLVNTHIHILKAVVSLLFVSVTVVNAQVMTLEQCVDSALRFNKTLKISQSEIHAAHLQKKEAVSAFIPKVAGNADYRYYSDLPYQLVPSSFFNGPAGVYKEAQFGVPHNLNASLAVDVTLYNPQAVGAIAISRNAQELVKIQYRQNEEQVVYEVTNLYYNAQLITNQIEFIEGSIVNAEKLLKSVELLYAQKMVRGTDVDKVRLQQNQLSTQLQKAKTQLESVVNLLMLQMGFGNERKIDVEKQFVRNEVTDPAVKETSDILLMNARQNLLGSEMKTLKLSHLPSFSFYGSYGVTGFGYYSGTKDFTKFYPVSFGGLKMSWMIFSGTTLELKISRKREELKQNKLRIELLKEKQLVQTLNAKGQLESATTQLSNTEKQLQLAESIYSKMLLQQQEGLVSLTDVLLADNSRREAQQNYLSALVDVMRADIELKKASGTIIKK